MCELGRLVITKCVVGKRWPSVVNKKLMSGSLQPWLNWQVSIEIPGFLICSEGNNIGPMYLWGKKYNG